MTKNELPTPAWRLVSYIETLNDFKFADETKSAYDHMGAIICEAGLQAGIKYDTVVWPRIEHVLNTYPEDNTTSGFHRLLMIFGATTLLNWKLDRKINTIIDVTQLFLDERVETADELCQWLLEPANIERLKQVNGVGNKTADYFKLLVGIPTSAIDRHLYKFLERADVPVSSYEEAQRVISSAAGLLDVGPAVLDHSIWQYMARKGTRQARQRR